MGGSMGLFAITGAGSGIGAATATLFSRAGANVVLGWYPDDPHEVEPVAEAITAAGLDHLGEIIAETRRLSSR